MANAGFQVSQATAVLSAVQNWWSCKQDAKSHHKLKSALPGQEERDWNPLACRHLAAGMMQIPRASFTGVEQLVLCAVAAIFAAADIKVNPKHLSKSCPSEISLQEIVCDGAVDCLLWQMDELKKARAAFLVRDTGNRKGVDHLAKVLSWWDETEGCVRSGCLDISGSGGPSENVGNAIDHSLKKLLDAVEEELAGQSHDGGGGSVGDSLVELHCPPWLPRHVLHSPRPATWAFTWF